MDIATIIGLVGGTVAIGLGVVTSGGSIGGIIDIPSVFVTVGGSYMALFIVAPLKQADDAVFIDSSGMTAEDVLDAMVLCIRDGGDA